MEHGHSLKEFKAYREKMNEKILERGNLQIKRFFNLDTQAYDDGALSRKTKELMGLVASLVLRCFQCRFDSGRIDSHTSFAERCRDVRRVQTKTRTILMVGLTLLCTLANS